MNGDIDINGIFERSAGPLFLSDDRGRLLFANRAFWELTETEPSDPAGRRELETRFVLLPTDLPVSHARRVERSWGAGRRQKWWSILLIPIADSYGDLLCVLGQVSASRDAPTDVPKASDSVISERLQRLRIEQTQRWGFDVFPARSEAMYRILRQLKLAIATREPVALVGESGVGKETLARLIHGQSADSGTFALLDCSSLPPSVQREQLLGSYDTPDPNATGAKGLLFMPGPGTLVIKHVARLGLDLQQEIVKAFSKPDCKWRLIVSAAESLFGALSEGRLVDEFYYLAATLVIRVPPLRERRAEFDDYGYWGLSQAAQRTGAPAPSIDHRAMEMLREYSWPGNLHELQTVLDQALQRCSNQTITARDLPRRLRQQRLPVEPTKSRPPLPSLDKILNEVERRLLQLALERTGGNKAQAADELGVSRARLLRKLEEKSRD